MTKKKYRSLSFGPLRFAAAACGVAGAVFAGVWLLLPPEPQMPEERAERSAPRERPPVVVEQPPPEMPGQPDEAIAGDGPAEATDWPEGALENELLVAFESSRELERFYQKMRGRDVEIVDVLGEFNAVRVRFGPGEEAAVRDAAGSGETGYNFMTGSPVSPDISSDGEPFTVPSRPWESEGSHQWGEGVRIAVLDTGVAREHPSLAGARVSEINLMGDTGPYEVGDHGTAVASIIAGSGEVPGIAPGAEILSVRVLDGDGVGNSFILAQGIVEAANQGADIVTVSLGSAGNNFLLDRAIEYARGEGSVIMAAAGNDGAADLLYPARHPDVMGVTAVDQHQRLAGFSNYGEGVSLAAPGVNLPAAGAGDEVLLFSGTSGAVPYAAGELAVLLDYFPDLSPAHAANILMENADDKGPAGPDFYHGQGVSNLERALNHSVSGLYDVAVADHFLVRDESGRVGVQVSVQNRGTETARNTRLTVSIDGRPATFQVGTLQPREVKAEVLPLPESGVVVVHSEVDSPFVTDIDPGNNRFTSGFNMDALREAEADR